jgi:hypothetical protein
MAFKEGKKPALVVAKKRLTNLVTALMAVGYGPHEGRKVRRPGEFATLRKVYKARGQERQCHVQIVEADGHVLVYAHTEPYMGRDVFSLIEHGISALIDGASYSAGTRMINRDLAPHARRLS